MAIGGRKPIPASLIDPAEHKKSKEEIELRQEIEQSLKTAAKLTCPKYLTTAAKKEWRRVIKLYKGLGTDILCDLDISSLVIYCEAWSVYRQAQAAWLKYTQKLEENPDAKESLPENLFKIMEKQSKIISSVSEQLCLTPVGRARMGIMTIREQESNPVDDLFREED